MKFCSMKYSFFIFFMCCCLVKAPAQKRPLDFFTEQAITNSPLVRDLQNQVKINQLDSLLILATQRTQVTFSSTNTYAPVIGGFGYDKAITNGANVSALVGVNKSLLNGVGNRVQFANIKLLSDAVRNNTLLTIQDIKRAVISQYITTYGDLLQLTFSGQIQASLIREEKILKKLTENNVYKQVDYLTFFVTLQQNEFKLKQQINQYRNDYATLNYLSGIADTSQPELETPAIELINSFDINQSPFFKKYYIDSLANLSSRSLIDITYRPKLNVFADAGYNSSLEYKPYKNLGTSVGISLLIPIYDGKQKDLQYRKIAAQEDTRVANRQFFTRQYYQQTAQLKQQLQAATELINDINLQLKYIETLITLNEKLLQTGDVRVYDYILALNNYLNAKNIINDNTITRLQLINQLNYWSR